VYVFCVLYEGLHFALYAASVYYLLANRRGQKVNFRLLATASAMFVIAGVVRPSPHHCTVFV
jgi:hypothetical protein